MICEIKLILDPDKDETLKGTSFEEMIREYLEFQQYEVQPNVQFTGMEIDLLAKHKVRKKEVLYAECKARKNIAARDISSFESNARFGNATLAYFIHTHKLGKQSSALVEKLESDSRYNFLTFLGPKVVIDGLISAKKISSAPDKIGQFEVSKKILLCTYFGDYYVLILKSSLLVPQYYCLIDAQTLKSVDDQEVYDRITKSVNEINDLDCFQLEKTEANSVNVGEVDSISEVQESESWHDYLPASKKHFVGRKKEILQFITFAENVLNKQTNRRVFYLTSKTGWGKSSFVNCLKGECEKKKQSERYYCLAIDCRSANSSSFVARSFARLIDRSIESGFIDEEFGQISFVSNEEILSSTFVDRLVDYLERKNKLLILVFDQFEDIFQNSNYFKTFYKFLCDVTDKSTNIVVGFSWRHEFHIPIENPAYSLWQQAQEQAVSFSLPEFGASELKSILNQLEKSLGGTLPQAMKNRLMEASQGFPWLIKKLCIHVYLQRMKGVSIDILYNQELNVEELFQEDMEGLTQNEIRALKEVANKTYEGGAVSILEFQEIVPSKTIDHLIQKRLLIKTGDRVSLYWDIFRDYLVTGKIPVIGESYIIRNSLTSCLELFMLLSEQRSVADLAKLTGKTQKYIWNVLHDLSVLGFVSREENDFFVGKLGLTVSRTGFKDHLKKKFQRYTLYLNIVKFDKIRYSDVLSILKRTFKGLDANENTWRLYANTFIPWLDFVGVTVVNPPQRGKGRRRKSSSFINVTYAKCLSVLSAVQLNSLVNESTYTKKALSVLCQFGLITFNSNGKFELHEETSRQILKGKTIEALLSKAAIENKLIAQVLTISRTMRSPHERVKVIEKMPIMKSIKSLKTKRQYSTILSSWVKALELYSP